MNGIEFIQSFLRTMEARDLDAAQAMMAPGAEIIFPGGKRFASQQEMVAAAKGRYQWVKKTFDETDHFTREDGIEVIYIRGNLYGVNQHGVEFNNIRYIDRFEVQENQIIRQEVWNDLAESGVLEQQAQEGDE